jgi:hypothetical protein
MPLASCNYKIRKDKERRKKKRKIKKRDIYKEKKGEEGGTFLNMLCKEKERKVYYIQLITSNCKMRID